MRGDTVVRMVPYKDGKANHGPFLRQGPLRVGLHHPSRTHPQTMIRERIEDRGAKSRGTRRSAGRERSSSVSRRNTVRARSAHHSSRCTDEETFLLQKLVRAASATTISTPARGSATRRLATASKTTFGTSAGTQDFDSVEQADVIVVMGANPTDAIPSFASRMKQRPAPGSEAHRHRSAPHRSRAHAAHRCGLAPAAPSPAPTSRC